jgi:hypothetical protein|tara:strand:- start:589 stop:1368 length:780 start_codon:yes stop_codon:yes gene_type:complete
MKYVISFTTSPTRIHKVKSMLESLLNQTSKPELIILNIPKVFKRTGEGYDVPDFIKDNVIVNITDQDYGPGTKVIPTIKYLKDNNFNSTETRIVYLDDDVIYPLTMIETMKTMTNDNSIYIGSGFDFRYFKNAERILPVRRNANVASVAEGYAAVCVRLDVFEEDFMKYINIYINDMDFYLSDDVVLSNYYCSKGITIKLVNIPGKFSLSDIWDNKGILSYGLEKDALHKGAGGISVNNLLRYTTVLRKLAADRNRYIT